VVSWLVKCRGSKFSFLCRWLQILLLLLLLGYFFLPSVNIVITAPIVIPVAKVIVRVVPGFSLVIVSTLFICALVVSTGSDRLRYMM
jgi:TRAP-type C4-dicarboxylate transport system permease large subunit